MVSNAPHNPTHVEVDEPTQPYSRSAIDRLRQDATLTARGEPLREQPEVTQVSARGMLTVVPEDVDEDAGDQGMEGWFELDGRWLRVCVRAFEHFGFSGAPPGMLGAVDASFMSGTIDPEGSAGFDPGPQRLEVEQAPAPELEPDDSQSFSRRHKGKLWVLVASPLALALAAWVFTRNADGPVQPMTRDAEQVRADVPREPPEPKPPVSMPSVQPEPIVPSPDVPTNKQEKRKPFAQSQECVERRKSAKSAQESGSWELLLKLAELHNCWSPARQATALRMEALFELGRYGECVQLGAQNGSKKEIRKWRNACQLNL